ncbi:MAG: adenine deaminase [Lachnospiraceae bacterium]
MNKKVIDVALGNSAADIVIRHGSLINVNSGEIYPADVAIADGKIAATGEISEKAVDENTIVIDASGKYLAPGFIDAHIHFESSMLTYTEFSNMVLKHGTTAVATDLMEVAIVSGMEGIQEVLKESAQLPVKLLYPVPSFMEEEGDLQTIGAPLRSEYIEELLQLEEAVGLAEVLYPPMLAKADKSANIVRLAKKYNKTLEGHAPALTGDGLNAYSSVGIRSDHESTNRTEALEKLRRGLRVLIREGSAATDLDACLEMITKDKVDTRHCALVSDDIDSLHIYEKGHLDYKVRRTIQAGVSPIEAIQMVTINPAESLKVDDELGSIAPGKRADIVLLSDLDTVAVEQVIAGGVPVVEQGELLKKSVAPTYSKFLKNTVTLKNTIDGGALQIKAPKDSKTALVRVIGANPTSLLTDDKSASLSVKDGIVLPDAARDVLSIACVERYGKNGNVGKAFIQGFGLLSGAIATSVGHDHHNITVIGSNFDDMALAVRRIEEMQGGILLVEDGKVIHELALPICGLLSDRPGEEVAGTLKEIQDELVKRGCKMQSPFMTLAFITLIFIPRYGITDKGLVDVFEEAVVDPVISFS